MDLAETALREWVMGGVLFYAAGRHPLLGIAKRADIDAGNGAAGALTSDERAELTQRRRENKRLQRSERSWKSGGLLAKENP